MTLKCGPTLPSKIIIWTNLNIPYLCRFHTSYSFSSQMNLENILKIFLYIFLCKKNAPPFVTTISPGNLIGTNINLHYPRMLTHKIQLFWQKDFGKENDFFYIFLCKFQTLVPTLHPGILIFTSENLHYLRMIPNKFQLSQTNGSKEDF